MADRQSSAAPGGFAGDLAPLVQAVADLKRDVAQLQRNADRPAGDFLWIAEGGILKVKRIETRNEQIIAGPM